MPDKVDTDEHADLLNRFAINPQQVFGGAGRRGEKLGFLKYAAALG